ncbi:unnamed protein product [Symbiodinium sp. CCMP2456]|nr:unnamed protein product [Symbiodinium sp. CCMP2456]
MRTWPLLRSTLGREPCLGHKQILRSFAGSTPERPRRNRRRANRGADVWGEEDDEKQSKNFRQLRAFAQADFTKDAQDAREALRWHRKEVHHAQEVKDALVEVSSGAEESTGRWWDAWDAEWDEGWDWEEKWRTAAGRSELVSKDDPRRPRGPLLSCEDGYQPVATLNHQELVAAIVSARNGQADELQWQALCRRAELVAMSMTPAELLAIARCVGERQSGQLRLLWKIAMLSVEHLGSFTVQDLACLANVYSSIDTVHHGMLNVVALVLASSDDERNLDHVLAADVLASFARAQYPLPLLLGEARKVLLRDSAELAPGLALSALESLSSLEGLDGELLAALLDRALPHSPSLQQTCATATWAWQVLALLEKLEVPAPLENVEHLMVRERPSISGRHAVERITATLSESLRSVDLRHLRFIQTGDASYVCLAVSQKGQPSQLPSPQILASALLLTHQRTETDSCLAAELVAASSGSMQPVWSAEQQVQWLRVAVEAAEAAPVSNAELVQPLLKALPRHAPHLLIPEAAILASLFPRILTQYPTSEAAVAETAVALAQAVRPDLFRLRVHEARQVLHGYCSLMPVIMAQVNAEKILPEASRLFKSILDGFPAKLKSESVFHRSGQGQGQPSAPELAAWCILLSNADLIRPLGKVPEGIWEVLASECQEALTAAGLGQESDFEMSGAAIAEQMLLSFLRKRGDHDWSILNPETPLGAMANAVQALWRRAVARDGELEDPMHEPPAIPGEDALRLRELMAQHGLELPEEVVI